LINRVNCYTTVLASGANTNTVPSYQLIDAGASFVTAGVSVGDVVVNTTLYEGAFVTSVSATALDITDDRRVKEIQINITKNGRYPKYSEI
jgi:hypothetical protein